MRPLSDHATDSRNDQESGAPFEDGLAGFVAAVADAVHEQVLAQERRPQVRHQCQHVLLDAREPADRSLNSSSLGRVHAPSRG